MRGARQPEGCKDQRFAAGCQLLSSVLTEPSPLAGYGLPSSPLGEDGYLLKPSLRAWRCDRFQVPQVVKLLDAGSSGLPAGAMAEPGGLVTRTDGACWEGVGCQRVRASDLVGQHYCGYVVKISCCVWTGPLSILLPTRGGGTRRAQRIRLRRHVWSWAVAVAKIGDRGLKAIPDPRQGCWMVQVMFSAAALARLEEDHRASIVYHRDFHSEIPTGGIIALAPGAGKAPQEIVNFYTEHGTAIFRHRRRWTVSQLVPSKYEGNLLKVALEGVLGDRRLWQSSEPLCVPSCHLVPTRFTCSAPRTRRGWPATCGRGWSTWHWRSPLRPCSCPQNICGGWGCSMVDCGPITRRSLRSPRL